MFSIAGFGTSSRQGFPVLLALTLGLLALFPLGLQAHSACHKAHSQTATPTEPLGEFRKNFGKPVVSQCSGSCYFETSVEVTESNLAKLFGKSTSISRPHFFAQTLLFRLNYLAQHGSIVGIRLNLENGVPDVMTEGNPSAMAKIATLRPLHIVQQKSQAQVEKENQVLQLIQNKTSQVLQQILHEHQVMTGLLESQKQGRIQITPDVQYALKKAEPVIESEIKRILQAHEIDPGPPLSKLAFHSTETLIEFEADIWSPRLKPEIENKLISHVSQGKELFLLYYHVKPYEGAVNGRPGFLLLPKDGPPLSKKEVTEKKLGGGHAAALVDVIRGPDGHIQFLVVRNSWGLKDGSDMGYYYISVDYLAEYGNASISEIDIIRKP